jgi:Lrp/AsnC family transcriptional regulator, leucine-responsive regulatory protein
MRTIDETDKHILWELQQNGRLTNQELADRVGLSPSPCLRRVRALEDAGVISGYRAVVDPHTVGMNITAFVRIKMATHTTAAVETVEEHLRDIPEVTEAYVLAGDHDYLLKVVTPSFETYERFLRDNLRTMPALASIETTFAFGNTKESSPLPLD